MNKLIFEDNFSTFFASMYDTNLHIEVSEGRFDFDRSESVINIYYSPEITKDNLTMPLTKQEIAQRLELGLDLPKDNLVPKFFDNKKHIFGLYFFVKRVGDFFELSLNYNSSDLHGEIVSIKQSEILHAYDYPFELFEYILRSIPLFYSMPSNNSHLSGATLRIRPEIAAILPSLADKQLENDNEGWVVYSTLTFSK